MRDLTRQNREIVEEAKASAEQSRAELKAEVRKDLKEMKEGLAENMASVGDSIATVERNLLAELKKVTDYMCGKEFRFANENNGRLYVPENH